MLRYLKPGTLGFCQKHCWVRLGQQAASPARLDIDHFYDHLDRLRNLQVHLPTCKDHVHLSQGHHVF